jgi:tol-pal system protein YbgF
MKRPPYTACLALSLLLLPISTGCASSKSALLRTEIQDLQNRIYELQKRNAEAQVEIQDLKEQGAGAPSAARPGEETVPGSTIDLGESGPVRNVEPTPTGPGVAPPGSSPGEEVGEPDSGRTAGAEGGEGEKSYVEGYALFNSGDYPGAEKAFQDFLSRSPESDLADDAQYWIGECFFSQKDHRRAILEFRKVIDQYPFGNRVPHAFLKIGLSYLALGDRERAAENLETVVQAFPKSDVATVARAALDEMHKP